MKELLSEIQAAVFMEYERSTKKFGRANNSPHESYAVIKEEFEEATEAGSMFGQTLNEFWGMVRNDEVLADKCEQMRAIAEHTAAEWVQVAAMCYKATL